MQKANWTKFSEGLPIVGKQILVLFFTGDEIVKGELVYWGEAKRGMLLEVAFGAGFHVNGNLVGEREHQEMLDGGAWCYLEDLFGEVFGEGEGKKVLFEGVGE